MIQGTARGCTSTAAFRGALSAPFQRLSQASSRAAATPASDLSNRGPLPTLAYPSSSFSTLRINSAYISKSDSRDYLLHPQQPIPANHYLSSGPLRGFSSFSLLSQSQYLRNDPDQADKEKSQGRGKNDKEDKEDKEDKDKDEEDRDEKEDSMKRSSKEERDGLEEDDVKTDYESLKKEAERLEKEAEEEKKRKEKKEEQKKKDTWYRKNGKIKLSVILGSVFLLIYGPSVVSLLLHPREWALKTLFSRSVPIVLDRPELQERLGKGYRVDFCRKKLDRYYEEQKAAQSGETGNERPKGKRKYRGGTAAREFAQYYDELHYQGHGLHNWVMYRKSTGDLYVRFRYFLKNRLDTEDGIFEPDFAIVSCEYIMRKGDYKGGLKPALIVVEFPDGEKYLYAVDGVILHEDPEFGAPIHYPAEQDDYEGLGELMGENEEIFARGTDTA